MPRAFLLVFLAIPLILSGCAGRDHVSPPAPALAAPAPTMPQPPAGLTDDTELLTTPNRNLSPAATVWHLRAGLNVAALQCSGASDALVEDYNHLLAAQRGSLDAAHRALMHGASDRLAFDRSMTAVYNYFAQPPASAGFCAVAAGILREAAALAPGALDGFAAGALDRLDQPFTKLHVAQDAYRNRLAAWRAGDAPQAPRLSYDPSVFLASDSVTGGVVRLSAR